MFKSGTHYRKGWTKQRAEASNSTTKEALELLMVAVDEIPESVSINKSIE
jgi:hypothetical protein